jgi:hypothetical protein
VVDLSQHLEEQSKMMVISVYTLSTVHLLLLLLRLEILHNHLATLLTISSSLVAVVAVDLVLVTSTTSVLEEVEALVVF